MRFVAILTAVFLLWGVLAFGQDPGVPDSLIIGTASMDSGSGGALVPLWATTDDTVYFVNLPIHWLSVDGRIHGADAYHSPPNYWDEYGDTVDLERSYFRILAWNCIDIDTIPHFLFTDNQRFLIFTLRFAIYPDAMPQMVQLDTTTDYRNGPIMFGLCDGITVFAPVVIPGSLNYGPVGIDDNDVGLPRGFALTQNYPNPFNARTTISYSLLQAGPVNLTIYNLLGQRVATLVDGWQTAGEYSVTWDAEDASSGVYFSRLTGGGASEIRKMILLR